MKSKNSAVAKLAKTHGEVVSLCQMALKLTGSHLHPTSFQKMNVAKAVQTFSNTVSSSLNVLIEKNKLDKSAVGTKLLCKFLNDIFDYMNNKDCCEIKFLKPGFYEWNKLSEMLLILKSFNFLSKATNKIKLELFELSEIFAKKKS